MWRTATERSTATRRAADADVPVGQIHAARWRAGPTLTGTASFVVPVAAAVMCAFAARRSVLLAVLVALVPVAVLLVPRPRWTAVAAVATLPLTADLLTGAAVKVSLPDVLLLVAVLGGVAVAASTAWSALGPAMLLASAYAITLVPSLVVVLDATSLLGAFHRLELVLVPLVVGGVVFRRADLSTALSLYVASASALGVAFAFDLLPPVLEFQKNPVGQSVAVALLVLAAGGRHRRLLAAPLLAYGLFATESRGAVLGLLAGLSALVVAQPGAARVRTAARLAPLLLVLGAAFVALPDDIQARTTTFLAQDEQPGAPGGGQYTIQIREAYRKDALRLIRQEPVTGVGLDHYRSGVLASGTLTSDPHNVVLLEAAEGGLPLAAGFSVLVIGSVVLLWRRRSRSRLVPLALAVQVSTVVHAMVDIYWVRGTPVLGWLLVGAVLAEVGGPARQAGSGPAARLGRVLRR